MGQLRYTGNGFAYEGDLHNVDHRLCIDAEGQASSRLECIFREANAKALAEHGRCGPLRITVENMED